MSGRYFYFTIDMTIDDLLEEHEIIKNKEKLQRELEASLKSGPSSLII